MQPFLMVLSVCASSATAIFITKQQEKARFGNAFTQKGSTLFQRALDLMHILQSWNGSREYLEKRSLFYDACQEFSILFPQKSDIDKILEEMWKDAFAVIGFWEMERAIRGDRQLWMKSFEQRNQAIR